MVDNDNRPTGFFNVSSLGTGSDFFGHPHDQNDQSVFIGKIRISYIQNRMEG